MVLPSSPLSHQAALDAGAERRELGAEAADEAVDEAVCHRVANVFTWTRDHPNNSRKVRALV